MPDSAGYTPLEGDADGALLRAPPRPKRSTLTPLRFCIGFCGLLGVVVGGLIVYGIVRGTRALYKDISKPHHRIHANSSLHAPTVAANESGIVRSFFGAKEVGGVDRFDLKAAIWGRVGEVEEGEVPHDESWQVLFEDIVLRDIDIKTKAISTVHPVTVPLKQISALFRNPNSTLTANFVMLPSMNRLDRSIDYHTYRSSRNLTALGEKAAYPPVNVKLDGMQGVFNTFLAGGVTGSGLTTRWIHKSANMSEVPAGEEPVWTERNETFIRTRSWVSMASDFAVYNYTSFNASLARRKGFRERSCENNTVYGGACTRTFGSDGHFENLVEFDNAKDDDPSTSTRVGWRYGPFLTGRAAQPGPKDYVKVHENITSDLTFNWTITWQQVTPTILSLGTGFLESMGSTNLPANKTEHEIGGEHDSMEILHSFFGHHYNANARPGTRALLRLVQFLLLFGQLPLDVYYWMSRSLTTGIAVYPLLIEMSYGFVAIITDVVNEWKDASLAGLVMGHGVAFCANLTVLIALLSLAFRLEWNWGGPFGMVPTGVSRRRATKSELKSKRAEALFPWQYQIAIFLVFFLLKRFGPALPHVVTANPPKPDKKTAEDAVTWFRVIHRELFDFASAPGYALSKMQSISQILLNHRTRHFAGMHRLACLFGFAHNLLEHIPTVFTSFFGTWQLRAPVDWDYVLALAIGAVQVWQALALPVVPQEEREEEE
ncbi:hypothetical protein JCM8547_003747 [Rhodosporidiobolus lusitaniae]